MCSSANRCPPDSPLLAATNVVAVPHIGSATQQTRENMAMRAVRNLIDALDGKLSSTCVNPEAIEARSSAQQTARLTTRETPHFKKEHAMNQSTGPAASIRPWSRRSPKDLHPDHDRYVRHCRWLIEQDVGLAVFGTNSEANSLAVDEKMSLLETLVDAGIPVDRLMPGTGCSALTDTVELTRHALSLGVNHVLMLPPFYYKGVTDEGLFRSYAQIIERVGSDALRIYLYHIPPVSQVPLGLALIERLLAAFRA